MQNFHTTAGLFIAILLTYLAITLILGAKQVYFDKYKEDSEEQKPEK